MLLGYWLLYFEFNEVITFVKWIINRSPVVSVLLHLTKNLGFNQNYFALKVIATEMEVALKVRKCIIEYACDGICLKCIFIEI